MRRILDNRLFWEWSGILCLLAVFAQSLNLHILVPAYIPCTIDKYGKVCELGEGRLLLFGGPWFWEPYTLMAGILLYIWLLAMWFYGRRVMTRENGLSGKVQEEEAGGNGFEAGKS